MASKELNLLGYDIGGTKIAVSFGTSAGRIYGSDRIENKNTRPEEILPVMAEIGRRLVAEAGLSMADVAAFGVSSPSPADIPNGIMTAPPNNPHWRNVKVKAYLAEALGIEGFFENDANCGALAEWFFGAGKGCRDMVYLTMSTGIGGGVIAGGHLIHGKGFLAGEFGHTVMEEGGRQCNCGLKGCYEAYCGGRALAQRMQEELADQPDAAVVKFAQDGKLEHVDLLALEKAVRAGDAYAVALWDEMCRRDAWAFGTIINIFNPEKLILGTLAWAAGDLFMEPVLRYLPRFAWTENLETCRIEASALRRDIGAYAGIAGALNALYEAGRFSLN